MRYRLTLYSIVISIIWYILHYLDVFSLDLNSVLFPLLWLIMASIIADGREQFVKRDLGEVRE